MAGAGVKGKEAARAGRSDPSFTRVLEDFIDTEEGRFWMECHGWAKVSKVIEEALVLPIASEDISEEAIVLIGGGCMEEPGAEGRDHPARAELGILGRVALVETAPSGKKGCARERPGDE